jgi:hypothetical protein
VEEKWRRCGWRERDRVMVAWRLMVRLRWFVFWGFSACVELEVGWSTGRKNDERKRSLYL